MGNSLVDAAQNGTTNKTSDTDCQFCGKDGLLILPLLYATLPVSSELPTLPSQLGDKVSDTKLATSVYTVRMVRPGFLYLLVNRKGYLAWQCYAATAEGYLSQFPAAVPPLFTPEFSCRPGVCGLNASMMAIREAKDVPAAYLLFTPDPLTEAKLNALKSLEAAEAACAKGQMVKFNPRAALAARVAGQHCLAAGQLTTIVPEFILGARHNHVFDSPLAKALLGSPFALLHQSDEDESQQQAVTMAAYHLSRLGSLVHYMAARPSLALVAFDPIGIAQQLNDHRNAAFDKINDFLGQADKDGRTNRWKFDTLQAIREVQTGLETGMAWIVATGAQNREIGVRARFEPIFPDDDYLTRERKHALNNFSTDPDRNTWTERHPDKVAAMQAAMDKPKVEGRERWNNKYAPLLDLQAIADFEGAMTAACKAATDLAENRTSDHLSWIESEHLLAALDLYDRNDLLSGGAFSGQVAMSVFGMTGVEAGAGKVDDWLRAGTIERKNLYMRGFLFNQADIEAEAQRALAEAGALSERASSAAVISGEKMYKAVKGLADLLRKADSAWDEYLRNQGQVDDVGANASKRLYRTFEGARLHQLAEINRSIGRAFIGEVEIKVVAKLGGLLYARLGDLAAQLSFQELMYGIDPAAPTKPANLANRRLTFKKNDQAGAITVGEAKATPRAIDSRRAARVASMEKNEIPAILHQLQNDAREKHQERLRGMTYTIEEYAKNPMTNNYHQARIGVLLGALEVMALATQAKHLASGNGKGLEYVQAVGSIFSIASTGFDVAYTMTKSLREQAGTFAKAAETATEVRARLQNIQGAADIARGGYKLLAGSLGAVAGFTGVILDVFRLADLGETTDRVGQRSLLWMKVIVGLANTALGTAAMVSYSGPLLQRYLINASESAARRRYIAIGVLKGVEHLASRVMLLRCVAWVAGLGWLLTLGDIAYETKLYFDSAAVQLWMRRCVFSKNANTLGYFNSSQQELTEFASARRSSWM